MSVCVSVPMISKLLNKKYLRFLFHLVALIALLFVLWYFLRYFIFSCHHKSLLNENFNEENSILARIKIESKDSNSVRFVASFDSDELLRLWQTHKSNVQSSGATLELKFFLHNPELCTKTNIDWLIYIISDSPNFEQRNLLRNTWANENLFKNLNIKVVFIVGQSLNFDVNDQIEQEFANFKDLVIGDFTEITESNTNKSVLALKWVSEYCGNAKFILKAVDTSFLNIFGVMELTKLQLTDRSIICPLWEENTMKIMRTNCGSYCVSKKDFPNREYYPQYCAAIALITKPHVIKDLYSVSSDTPYFPIEDVYTTGILPVKLSTPLNFISCLSSYAGNEKDIYNQYTNNLTEIEILMAHVTNTTIFKMLWFKLLQRLDHEWVLQLSDQVISSIPSV